MQGEMGLTGQLVARKVTAPGPGLMWKARNMSRAAYWRGWLGVQAAKTLTRLTGIPTLTSELRARVHKRDGRVIDYGVLGYRVVTTAFCAFVVDQLQTETAVFGDFKYHDAGVGVTAENVTDTAIETTDGEARAAGTQTEGTSVQYVSVGTIAYTTSKAITEHGLFNDATTGTLMDRTVFAAVNVVSGDSISFTYTISMTAGS